MRSGPRSPTSSPSASSSCSRHRAWSSASGRLDAGFNVAGIGIAGEIVHLETSTWNRILMVCLTGVMFSMRAEAAQMVRQGHGGAIVNVASVNAQIPSRGGAVYCAAKAGAEMLTRVGALELAEHGIRVNTVSPGLTDTPLTAQVMANDAIRQAYLDRIPAGTVGTPEQMAAAALYLASDDAGYVSGVDLPVDGAWRTSGNPGAEHAFDSAPYPAALEAVKVIDEFLARHATPTQASEE